MNCCWLIAEMNKFNNLIKEFDVLYIGFVFSYDYKDFDIEDNFWDYPYTKEWLFNDFLYMLRKKGFFIFDKSDYDYILINAPVNDEKYYLLLNVFEYFNGYTVLDKSKNRNYNEIILDDYAFPLSYLVLKMPKDNPLYDMLQED